MNVVPETDDVLPGEGLHSLCFNLQILNAAASLDPSGQYFKKEGILSERRRPVRPVPVCWNERTLPGSTLKNGKHCTTPASTQTCSLVTGPELLDPQPGIPWKNICREGITHTYMDLYLLRHGKAEKTVPSGGSDNARPLTGRGKSEMQEIASWIRTQGCVIDCIATSPLIRAKDTAAIIAGVYPDAKGPELWEELAPGVEFDRLMDRIRTQHTTPSLLLIGHEPSMSAFLSRIISGSGNVRIALRKGGLAKIVNFFPSEQSTGDLVWLLSPRHMRKMV